MCVPYIYDHRHHNTVLGYVCWHLYIQLYSYTREAIPYAYVIVYIFYINENVCNSYTPVKYTAHRTAKLYLFTIAIALFWRSVWDTSRRIMRVPGVIYKYIYIHTRTSTCFCSSPILISTCRPTITSAPNSVYCYNTNNPNTPQYNNACIHMGWSGDPFKVRHTLFLLFQKTLTFLKTFVLYDISKF